MASKISIDFSAWQLLIKQSGQRRFSASPLPPEREAPLDLWAEQQSDDRNAIYDDISARSNLDHLPWQMGEAKDPSPLKTTSIFCISCILQG